MKYFSKTFYLFIFISLFLFIFSPSVSYAQFGDIIIDLPGLPGLPSECCSSVVFLPGIKASELYSGNDRLWPPSILSNDVNELKLDENGVSINGVYVGDILRAPFGIEVYKSFGEFMDGLVADGVIKEWKPFPYDWRYDFDEILANGIKYETETVNILNEIKNIALRSDTGKVTIIGHSNGGLFAKTIIDKLNESGDAGLVDQLITIGTPNLGTPKAIAALLHGYDEGLGFGLVLTESTARSFAQNLQSAYNLLPSKEYLTRVIDPVITFDATTDFTKDWRDVWGSNINSDVELFNFLSGNGPNRDKPSSSDTNTPEVLSVDLLNKADVFHTKYDNWTAPVGIETTQVAGWGIWTVKSVNYSEGLDCYLFSVMFGCNKTLEPKFLLTVEGDETVVYSSAVTDNNPLFFNIQKFNTLFNEEVTHKDIMSSQPIQSLVLREIKNQNGSIPFVSATKPLPEDSESALLVSTHSPISIGVIDGQGRFTGIVSDPNPASDILLIKKEIPNSSYINFGEGKYIIVPAGAEYTFEMNGEGEGLFSVEIDEISLDEVVNSTTYSNLSVNENTKATLTIATTSVQVLSVDTNGDGVIDITPAPDGTELTLEEKIELFKTTLHNTEMNRRLKRWIYYKFKKFEKGLKKLEQNENNKDEIEDNENHSKRHNEYKEHREKREHEDREEKGSPRYLNKILDKIIRKLEHKSPRKVSNADAQVLIDILTNIKNSL